jgi:hypothetical protein
MVQSSRIRLDSTIGDEVAFMIAGFRAGAYPPRLNSLPLMPSDVEEILEWWWQYQLHGHP